MNEYAKNSRLPESVTACQLYSLFVLQCWEVIRVDLVWELCIQMSKCIVAQALRQWELKWSRKQYLEQVDLLHFEASYPRFAFFCTSCLDFFIFSLLFSHLLMLFEVSFVTSLNNYPLFCLMIFGSEEKTVILSLPLHNALTIHSLLPAYEATLQGN